MGQRYELYCIMVISVILFVFIGVEVFGAWSTSGCREVVRDGNKRVCEGTQLAHFGILFVSVALSVHTLLTFWCYTSGFESKATNVCSSSLYYHLSWSDHLTSVPYSVCDFLLFNKVYVQSHTLSL